ncbi:MAG: hypothetical protein AMXMBFR64_25310 [Myxococcales bacterium]
MAGREVLPVLDAHARHPAPFLPEEFVPWVHAKLPDSQRTCLRRQQIMRRARSAKNRPLLLAELENRYRGLPPGG